MTLYLLGEIADDVVLAVDIDEMTGEGPFVEVKMMKDARDHDSRGLSPHEEGRYSAGYERCWRDLSITLEETLLARIPIVVEQVMQIMAAKADPRVRSPQTSGGNATTGAETGGTAG